VKARCGWCGVTTHASTACSLQAPPAPLTGATALRLLIPVNTALDLVVTGRAGTTLDEVQRTRTTLEGARLKFGAYYGNYVAAYTELAKRIEALPAAEVAHLRAAAASLRAAEAAFAAAAQPIATRLGVGERSLS